MFLTRLGVKWSCLQFTQATVKKVSRQLEERLQRKRLREKQIDKNLSCVYELCLFGEKKDMHCSIGVFLLAT